MTLKMVHALDFVFLLNKKINVPVQAMMSKHVQYVIMIRDLKVVEEVLLLHAGHQVMMVLAIAMIKQSILI